MEESLRRTKKGSRGYCFVETHHARFARKEGAHDRSELMRCHSGSVNAKSCNYSKFPWTAEEQFLIQMYNKYVKDDSPAVASLTSQSSDTEVIQPWKKIKLDMLAKHASSSNNIEREIQQFRCLPTPGIEDLNAWWCKVASTFPRLAKLARIVLAIPATSAPERVFFIAGLTISAKRVSLAPSIVSKIISVHENASICIDDK